MHHSNDPNQSLHHREEIGLRGISDHIDLHSPPAAPLQFPYPTFLPARRSNVLVTDHKTGCRHLAKAIVKRPQRGSLYGERTAYFLKAVLTKSADKLETTWAAIVLRSTTDSRNTHANDEMSPFGVDWKTSEKVVLIKVSTWGQLSHRLKEGLIHVGKQRS
jgi:hypothetical protein